MTPATAQPSRSTAISLLAVSCLTIMVGCVIAPGVSGVALGLGVVGAESWLITLPSLGVVLFAPLAGRLITGIGPRQALRIGLVLYGLLGVAGMGLHGFVPVFADRLLLGAATVVVMASGTNLIAHFYHGAARLQMIARQGMAIECGGVVFLTLGGILAGLGWRWPFTLYSFAWVCLILVEITMKDDRPRPANEPDGAIAAPVASSSVFDVYAAATASMIVFFTAVVTLPIQFHRLGISDSSTGFFLSYVSLMAVGAAFTMPRAIERLGPTRTLALGFALYAVGHLLFGLVVGIVPFVAAGLMLGAGFGLTVPLVNHLVIERSAPARLGHNLSLLSMALFLGQFLASFVGVITSSYTEAFYLASAIAALAAITLGLTNLRRNPVS